MYYSVGSTFIAVPHLGTFSGFTISPSLSIPLSPKLSVDGGIIAGRYYSSLLNFNTEGPANGTFNALSLYGSAIYHINPQLTVYGTGIRQLAGTIPYPFLPKTNYAIGSTYNFGNFSIGVTMQMSNSNGWNDILNSSPFNSSQAFYFPYVQRPVY